MDRETLEAAARDLAEAAKRTPENASVRRWMGYRCYLANDFAGAAAAWGKAIELDPNLKSDLEPDIADAERRK
jgi:Flp pilus assembly protein TadD